MFESPLIGQGKAVAEFFRDRSGELISCLVRGDRVLVFKDSHLKGSFQIVSDVEALPENMAEVFQPLEIFEVGSGSVLLVVREGVSDKHSFLTTYTIDIERMNTDKVT